MARRLLFLNGLAILMIPIQHATAYTLQAMFGLFDNPTFRVTTDNSGELLNSFTYYLIVVLRQLSTYSVPAFLCISAFFLVFVARSMEPRATLNSVMPRIRMLVPPFIIWTVMRYVLLRRSPNSLDEVLDPYHFVPLLIQWYFLSPWLVPLAKKNWKLLLTIAAVVQFGIFGLKYFGQLGVVDLKLAGVIPRWIIIGQQPLWFPLGLIFGIHFREINPWFARHKWKLVGGTVLFGLLSILEYHLADAVAGVAWIGPTFSGFSRTFYILFFIMAALAFDIKVSRSSKVITELGSRSLGIYLANIPAIYVTAVIFYKYLPWLLDLYVAYLILLAAVGLGGPLLLMRMMRESPVRTYYRTVFG